LCSWPEGGDVDSELLGNMQKVREVVSTALELRQKAGHKVRQPLGRLKIKDLGFKNNTELLEVIKDEINVKEIVFDDEMAEEVWLDTDLTEDLREEGKVRDIVRVIQDWRKENNFKPGEVKQYKIPNGQDEFFEKHREEIEKVTNVELVK
jgi:Domain of unknown function (DUF5915)